MANHGTVCTVTDCLSLCELVTNLHHAGFSVPCNIAWGIQSAHLAAARAALAEQVVR